MLLQRGHGFAVDWWALGIVTFEMLQGRPPFVDETGDALKTYQKILEGKIRFPAYFDKASKELIKGLLTADVARRLGSRKGGEAELKAHVWFTQGEMKENQTYWSDVLSRTMRPPIPPFLDSKTDAGNFETYPDSLEVTGKQEVNAKDQALFADF